MRELGPGKRLHKNGLTKGELNNRLKEGKKGNGNAGYLHKSTNKINAIGYYEEPVQRHLRKNELN